MALISPRDAQRIKETLDKELENEVNILYFTQRESPLLVPGQECLYCRETRELLEEVSALSDKIRLQVYDFVADKEVVAEHAIDKIPAFIIKGAQAGEARYFGIPSGYEFATLVEGIIEASKETTDLSPATKEDLQKIDQDVHIQVFVTPT
ncbi:MAG: thioredoxin family protein [Chloroflexi bacterium]|nr:thioredoxin family protein [Chloroflexota bacterium]